MAAKKSAFASLSKHGKQKFTRVLHEFASGTLKSSAGQKITDRKQAIAIAFSEGRRYG